MSDLPAKGAHIHLIAICGVGMASLAGLLQSQGYRVTGSDENVYPPMSTYLSRIGIQVLAGYDAQHLNPRPDLVVVGNAVSRGNAEAQAMIAGGIPHISFPQAIGRFLIGDRSSMVVAGTHGKTTTAALCAWVLTSAGADPGFFVGGVPNNFGSGWNVGNGSTVVLEGDEYDTAFFDKGPKFLHYRPQHVILTSVEFDHADIYRDLDHLKGVFQRLMEIVPAEGRVVVCADYPAGLEVASHARCRVSTYGEGEGSQWTAVNVTFREGRSTFEPCWSGRSEGAVELALIGRHNIQNALAVYVMARGLGFERSRLLDGFATFAGVKRRQEIVAEQRGILLVDDFAHHPTAVRETINAFRAAYPGRRLWAVFEPRSNTSRRNIFEQEFAQALALADKVVVGGLYLPEKVPEGERLSVGRVIEATNRLSGNGRAVALDKAEDIAGYIASNASSGDVVLIMSNGGFGGVHQKIIQALST